MLIETTWLMMMLVIGWWWVRRDMAEFRRFTTLDDTLVRQRVMRRWIGQSFVLLTTASLISLWLVGGLQPFDSFPDAFAGVRIMPALPDRPITPEMAAGIAVGVSLNLALFGFIQWRRLRTIGSREPTPIDALVPRNRAESAHALLLSINAGFSEELFFRLALPLLLLSITGSVVVALALALLCFGFAHGYQGWRGIMATMIAGGVITLVYFKTQSLLHVMVLHAGIDVVALLVRPRLAGWFRQWLSRADTRVTGA